MITLKITKQELELLKEGLNWAIDQESMLNAEPYKLLLKKLDTPYSPYVIEGDSTIA